MCFAASLFGKNDTMFSGHFGSFRVFAFFWSESQYVFLSVAGVTWDPMHSIRCSSARLSRWPHTVGNQPREAKNIKHSWFYPHGLARRISQQNFPANARKRLSKPPREVVCSALSLCRGLKRSLAKKGKRSLVSKLTRPTSLPNWKLLPFAYDTLLDSTHCCFVMFPLF